MTPTVPPHPGSSSPQVSARMARAARRETAPELALRRALHADGYRFRVVHPVPGNRRRSIDIAFTRARVAVFVDGCFWHGCPVHGTQPRANSEWWTTKLAANRERDVDTDRLLREAGWQVVRVWEHEPVEQAVAAVVAAVSAARGQASGQ
ncbi:very short patch repair endonuclease [Ornithinimicrobium sp. LYQ103]|uniref:very short patch repair endonuclease n=1 Tax=Ornithinimicrobium sp. LYQ103 TaxID=3378796 RepID=UPI0038529AFD